LPHGLIHKLARKRRVTVGRRRTEPACRLERGDRVELWEDLSCYELPSDHAERAAERVRSAPSFRRRFRLLHEDESIIVLDKPGGLVVHPGPDHHRGDTLLDLLRAHLPVAFAAGSSFRPAFVHRLDRGTSGIIMAAKTREAARALERALEGGGLRKVYLALVHGRVRRQEGDISLPIRGEQDSSGVTRYRAIAERASSAGAAAGGKREPEQRRTRSALTHYSVERRFRRATLLELEPATGRTHQLRVHLAALGHAIIGDGDYGKKQVNRHYRERFGLRRLFLHAAALELPHPRSGDLMTFRAPLPRELVKVIEGLEV
jgi:RluA family pseudouridine synthase